MSAVIQETNGVEQVTDWEIPDEIIGNVAGVASNSWRVFINDSLPPGRVFIDTDAPNGHLDFYVNNTGTLGRRVYSIVTLMSLSHQMLDLLRTLPEESIDHFSDEMRQSLVTIIETTRKV